MRRYVTIGGIVIAMLFTGSVAAAAQPVDVQTRSFAAQPAPHPDCVPGTGAGDPEPEPADPEPTDPEPTDPEPTDPEPTDPEPTRPDPADPADPADPEPAEPDGPTADPEPAEPGVGEPGAAEPADVEPAPAVVPPAAGRQPPVLTNPVLVSPVLINPVLVNPTIVTTGPAAPDAVPAPRLTPVPAIPDRVPAASLPAASLPAASLPAASLPAAPLPAAPLPAALLPAALLPAALLPAAPLPATPVPAAAPAAARPATEQEEPTDDGHGDEPTGDEPTGDEPTGDEPAEPGAEPAVDDCDTPGSSAGEATSAAAKHNWGAPNQVEEFDGPLGDDWGIYDGPGHEGEGRRTPNAVSISDGVMTITGDRNGATAGMAWADGQQYGRWEGRVRVPVGDPSYNALLLLWPDAENWPVGGELDFMEISDPSRQTTELFLHYGADNNQVQGSVDVDATEWRNWAVEWTPTHVAAFVDGREWWRTTDTSILPPGPMHLTIQLDWFPEGNDVQESSMYVDWVKQYPLGAGGLIDGAVELVEGVPGAAGELAGAAVEGAADVVGGVLGGRLAEGGPEAVPARRGLVERAVPAPR